MRQIAGSTAIVPLCIVALSLGCVRMDRNRVVGSDVAASEQRQIDNFSQISIEGAINARITIGDEPSLVVEGDDNVLPLIKTEVRGQKLIVSSTQPYSSRMGVRVIATVPQLSGVSIHGSGDVDAKGVHGESFAVAINGSGDVTASGQVESIRVAINGSGDVKLADVQAKTGKVAIAGSGDVTVNASEALEVSVAGSGDVKYVGSPKISKSVAGSGNVRQVG